MLFYRMKEYILKKLKLKRKEKENIMIDDEFLRRERERRLEKKRQLCEELIEKLRNLTEIEVSEESKESCIKALEEYKNSDHLKYTVDEFEVLGTLFSTYFSCQGGKISLTTNAYDYALAAGHHTHEYTPEDIVRRYDQIKTEQQKEKGMH